MIREEKGDLLEDSEIGVIVHCCNCFHTMGAGIAAQIKKKYPEAFEADKTTKYGSVSKLGSFSYAKTKDDKLIINLYAQYHFGINKPHFCLKSFKRGLKKLCVFLKTYFKNLKNYPIIGIPKYIGCGLAGGNWEEVKSVLDEEFSDSKIFTLKIVEFAA